METENKKELTVEKKGAIKKKFDEMCAKGRDGLSQKQAREALFDLGQKPTVLDVAKFWADLEKEEGSCLSLDEFEQLCCYHEDEPDRVLRWAFHRFDKNNDGTIDKDELRGILTTVYDDKEGDLVDEQFVNDVFVMADSNNDGVLQIEEFVDMLMARTVTPTQRN